MPMPGLYSQSGTDWDGQPGIGTFKNLPGDPDVQPKLGTTDLQPCFSKYGLQKSGNSLAWELMRNVVSRAPPRSADSKTPVGSTMSVLTGLQGAMMCAQATRDYPAGQPKPRGRSVTKNPFPLQRNPRLRCFANLLRPARGQHTRPTQDWRLWTHLQRMGQPPENWLHLQEPTEPAFRVNVKVPTKAKKDSVGKRVPSPRLRNPRSPPPWPCWMKTL